MEAPGKIFEVTDSLSGVIRHLYCIQTPSDFKALTQHLSPNLEMMLVFNFGAPVRASFANDAITSLKINRVALVGPLRRMLNYEVLANTDFIAVVFSADGFHRLFQLPMNDFSGDHIIDPDVFFQTTIFNTLWETLKSLPSLDNRIQLLQDYARTLIHEDDDVTASLINNIAYFNNPSVQPVKAMAMDQEVSERTIQLRLKKQLGYSSKELLRFLRFKQVINHILNQPSQEVDWYTLVEEFEYHDQSHLTKDFHHYLGTTPQKFVREIVGKEFCVSKPGKYYS